MELKLIQRKHKITVNLILQKMQLRMFLPLRKQLRNILGYVVHFLS